MNDNNHEAFFFTQGQKRRIHEQDYAIKVISHTKVDKETIQLSESLFNAKITAKQSSCIIRDIQRCVQQKIKLYDEYLKTNDSFKKQNQTKSFSTDIIKPKMIESQQQSQNQQQSEQQNIEQSSPIKYNQQIMQTPIKSSAQKQSSRYSLRQYTQSISPTKKQPNSSRKKTTNNSSPQIKHKSNSQYLQQKERQSCFSKLQGKEQQKEQEEYIQSTNRAQTARVSAISERNQEWKQKLKNKMDNEQKKQQQKEMIDCTFKPKINNLKNTKQYQKSVSKEFQTEIKELMHLIDNQSQVKNKQ